MTEQDSNKEPCPFCGNSEHFETTRGPFIPLMRSVYCDICGCSGPIGKNIVEAVGKWNSRLRLVCRWEYREDGSDSYWETSCGEEIIVDGSTPAECGFRFCPSCGKVLEEHRDGVITVVFENQKDETPHKTKPGYMTDEERKAIFGD